MRRWRGRKRNDGIMRGTVNMLHESLSVSFTVIRDITVVVIIWHGNQQFRGPQDVNHRFSGSPRLD